MTELEARRIEYQAAQRAFRDASLAASAAGSALIEAIIAAGLDEYGPITSTFEFHLPSEEYRRVWKHK